MSSSPETIARVAARLTEGARARDEVRKEFTRWDGYPKAMRTAFQSHWCDVDAMADEIAALRTLLQHGACATDLATLRNVQEQKNKVVDAALRWSDSDSVTSVPRLSAAVAELRRITT